MNNMIELYYCPTHDGPKITMFLEAAGRDYTIRMAAGVAGR